ncbi:MAG TPA: tetratricopeptide repeat protein [Phenylobacterium sp.]
MARSAKLTAASPSALQLAAGAAPARASSPVEGILGANSAEALARLNAAMSELKALSVEPLVKRAAAALNANDHVEGAKWAIKALEKDERSGAAWYVLAFARERSGDFASSLKCFEMALQLLPDHAQVANDLGRLAVRMGMLEHAEKLFAHFIHRHPDSADGWNNLACVMRDRGRFAEATDVLKASLANHPENPMLWNTLGTVLSESGDTPTAMIFYEEALRLQPTFAKAQYNLANMRLALGQAEKALADCDVALDLCKTDDERQMMLLARSAMLLNLGRLTEGWDEYECRLHHQFDDATIFMVDRPRWQPGDDLAGKSLLVVGEQGLGDEILFANVLEDLEAAVGPEGRLTIAVEHRLVPLFQRSFPRATVGAHVTHLVEARTVRFIPFLEDPSQIDLWTPIASTLRQYRQQVQDFPVRDRFLTADPERIAHWKDVLETQAPAGRKVGILWKSALLNGGRGRYFSRFDQWEPVLRTPGVCLVNLQYGDCAEELAYAQEKFGVEIWQPPGIDLKQDLDDLAALCAAMDLVVGFSNATLNIAAACGAPTWLITTPGVWPRLGTDRYPWYPQARVFQLEAYGAWEPVMEEVAQSMASFAAGGTGASAKG